MAIFKYLSIPFFKMATAAHARGNGFGKNGGYFTPRRADRVEDERNERIVIEEGHFLYDQYSLWTKTEEVLGALGFQLKYSFPDWVSRHYEGRTESREAWNYWHAVQDNLHKYPNVMRKLTQDEIDEAIKIGSPFEETTTWNSDFKYPQCLTVDGETLPLVRPAWLETVPPDAAFDHPQKRLPAMATYREDEITDLFWSLRAMCPLDVMHPSWDHRAQKHQKAVHSSLDHYHPELTLRDLASGVAIALAQHLFGCSASGNACNLFAYVMTPWVVSLAGDDTFSARGIPYSAIQTSERIEQVLRYDPPSFGEYMIRIATFGPKDGAQVIAAQQWNIMEAKVSNDHFTFRKVKDTRPAVQIDDAHPVIAQYNKFKNGDQRFIPVDPAAAVAAPGH